MAILTISELRSLVAEHTSWLTDGMESPNVTLGIEFDRADRQITPDSPLRVTTVTYESRNATLIVDLDAEGFVISLEIV